MKKLCAVLLLGTLSSLLACGGKVLVDGVAGVGGGGGAGGASPTSCPAGQPDDKEVQSLLGKPCNTASMVCASNNGCGGCSVTCKNGAWVSTDTNICFSVGPTC